MREIFKVMTARAPGPGVMASRAIKRDQLPQDLVGPLQQLRLDLDDTELLGVVHGNSR